jgi:thiol-disulfide isomerase/thioredoxin
MKKVLRIIFLCVISLATFTLVAFIGSYSFALKLLLSGLIYCVITCALLSAFRKLNLAWIFIIMLLPIVIISLPMHIADFYLTFLSFPSFINSVIGILFADLLKLSGKIWKPIYAALLIVISLIGYSFVYPLIYNKVNFGYYQNEVSEQAPKVTVVNSKNETITLDSIGKNKMVLVDFWNRRCLPCYQLFPFIDSINKLNSNPSINIFALNIPLINEKPEASIGILESKYSFATLYAVSDNLEKEFKIISYPTTLVIQNERILFRGDFLDAYKFANSFTN